MQIKPENDLVLSPRGLRFIAGIFCVTVLGLLTFGFVMLASTSAPAAYHGDAFYFAKRQALWLGVGLAACAGTAWLDYRRYRAWARPLLGGALFLLVVVLIFGRRINGATRWLVFDPVRFQPSEFAKYALVIFLACWLEEMQRARKGQLRPRIGHWWWGVFAPLAFACGPAFLVLKEPDLGTAVLLLALALALLWVAGAPARWLAAVVGAGGLGLAAFLVAILKYGMFAGSYQVQRIVHWWRWDDLDGSNYQQWKAMLAFGRGGTWGHGLGNSIMKMAYLPEAHTDFIFPIIGEELGLAATLSVVAAFCVVLACGFRLARRAPDLFGLLLGSGIMTAVGLQAFINIAVTTSVLPNKGMALPLISYGGSNLVMTLAALGVVLNIYRQAHAQAVSTAASLPDETLARRARRRRR